MSKKTAAEMVAEVRKESRFGETDEFVDGYELSDDEAAQRLEAWAKSINLPLDRLVGQLASAIKKTENHKFLSPFLETAYNLLVKKNLTPAPTPTAEELAEKIFASFDFTLFGERWPAEATKRAVSKVSAIISSALTQAKAEARREAMTFDEIEAALLAYKWKSEYMQAAIIVVRHIFEGRAAILGHGEKS